MKPAPKVLTFVAGTPLTELYISAVTLAELRFGIEVLSSGNRRRADLENWFSQTIRPMFDQRVLPFANRSLYSASMLTAERQVSRH